MNMFDISQIPAEAFSPVEEEFAKERAFGMYRYKRLSLLDARGRDMAVVYGTPDILCVQETGTKVVFWTDEGVNASHVSLILDEIKSVRVVRDYPYTYFDVRTVGGAHYRFQK